MAEIPVQETFDQDRLELALLWFPAGKGDKRRPTLDRYTVEKPRGKGSVWTFAARVTIAGLERQVVVKTRNPGEHMYLLAEKLEDLFQRMTNPESAQMPF